MIGALLSLWARPTIQYAALALLVAAVAACAGLTIAWQAERVAHQTTKAAAATREASWQAATAQAEREAREFEAQLQRQANLSMERDREHQQIISQQAARALAMQDRIVRLGADLDRLRSNLAGYAGAGGAEDSLAACRARAGRLADLLAEGAGLLGESSELVRAGASLAREAGIAAQQRASELDACVSTYEAIR